MNEQKRLVKQDPCGDNCEDGFQPKNEGGVGGRRVREEVSSVECQMSGVEGGFDGEAAALEDVGVDHGGFYILVSKQFLNGSYIVSVLEKMSGEGMSEGVRGNMLVDLRKAGGFFDGFLYGGFVEVVTVETPSPTFPLFKATPIPAFPLFKCGNGGRGFSSGVRVFGEFGGREEVLPDPFFGSARVFFGKRIDGRCEMGR